jgi:hypothetical protein
MNTSNILSLKAQIAATHFDHKTSFKTIDTQCNALEEGEKVEVLYNPHDPSIAKTSRQSSADIRNGIIGTIIWPIFALFYLFLLVTWIVGS